MKDLPKISEVMMRISPHYLLLSGMPSNTIPFPPTPNSYSVSKKKYFRP